MLTLLLLLLAFVSIPEVLEEMPLSISRSDTLFLMKIPAEEFLGTSEKDFSNVKYTQHDNEGNLTSESPQLAFPCGGRLGCLKGGLLHLEDVRNILTREEIQNMAVEQTSEMLAVKRKGLKQIFSLYMALSVPC